MTVTVSSKGQIAVPKEIRETLHIKEGTILRITVRGNDLILSKPEDWRTLVAGMQSRLKGSGRLTDALLEERAKDRLLEDSR